MNLTVDIEKRIGSFQLRSSFSVEGERFALLGASGCGKTMTLKCIAGIEKPDRGRIVMGDRVLFDSEKKVNLPARDRKVGYLFQNYALFPNMTVRKNITCAAEDKGYAEHLIERFCLTEVADQYPAELSGGQSQRTALARMLSVRPEAILLDEPFSALDNYMRTRMEHEILDILEEFSGPSVLVTHDRNEAYRLADRIGVMEEGAIVEIQGKQEFFDQPRTVAAARLTGCKNISRLEQREDGSFYAVDWGIPIAPAEGQTLSGVPYLGYRAHYFTFVPGTGKQAGGRFPESGTDPSGSSSKSTDVPMPEANAFHCELQRVIEDTFSVVICFRQKGQTLEEPDTLLTWIVGKDAWEDVKAEVLSGHFTLRLAAERLMLLEV